jgi:hypothetical protein
MNIELLSGLAKLLFEQSSPLSVISQKIFALTESIWFLAFSELRFAQLRSFAKADESMGCAGPWLRP